MTILEEVCNNYSGDVLLGTVSYLLIHRDDPMEDGTFGVIYWHKNGGGFPIFEGSDRVAIEEEARAFFERAEAEMKRRYGMCVPWPQTAAALAGARGGEDER